MSPFSAKFLLTTLITQTLTTGAYNTRANHDLGYQYPPQQQQQRPQQIDLNNILNDPTPYFFGESLVAQLDGKMSIDDYIDYSSRSLAKIAGIDNDWHRYDDKNDLHRSFSTPEAYNIDLCYGKLVQMLVETRKLYESAESYSTSLSLRLAEQLDAFGAPEPMLMKGNNHWLGSHSQCEQISNPTTNAPVARYCIANMELPRWQSKTPDDNSTSTRSLKIGVCLPAECNSLASATSADINALIGSILKVARLSSPAFANYELTRLYCLPDEASPLRQLSTSALLFLAVIGGWLMIVAFFSLRLELAERVANQKHAKLQHQEHLHNLTNAIALRANWRHLFACPSATLQSSSSKRILQETSMKTKYKATQTTAAKKVDLSPIDGLKVVSMCWLVSAHCLLYFMKPPFANARDLWFILQDTRFVSIMAGIFPVDTFFTITGVLTAYLFLSNNSRQTLSTARFWLEALAKRYLRFLPMYLLMFWYTRDVSVYIGAGPLWDYATASKSLRGICKQESVLVPLTFTANFKPFAEHCVKPAWYLANDVQFLAITPIFLLPLAWNARVGKLLIWASLTASLVAQFTTVFFASDIKDFETLINFKPMFATFIFKICWRLYVLPHNRVPPFLVGLLAGYRLFKTSTFAASRISGSASSQSPKTTVANSDEIFRLRRLPTSSAAPLLSSLHHQLQDTDSGVTNSDSDADSAIAAAALDSPASPINYQQQQPAQNKIRFAVPLLTLVAIVYLPLVSLTIQQHGLAARIGSSALIAIMRLVWSLAIGRLIILSCVAIPSSSTSTTNLPHQQTNHQRFFLVSMLSATVWRPLAKIGLSTLLIQWEVINWLVQTQPRLIEMSLSFLLSVAFFSIVLTYLISLATYLLIEFPISQLVQLYLQPLLFASKSRTKERKAAGIDAET